MGDPSCHPLDAADLPALVRALDAAGPASGDAHLPGRRFFRFAEGGEAFGDGGLEGAGPDMLPRSVVVRPERRGAGFGAAVVLALEGRALEGRASASGGARLRLPTATAADFFARLGHRPAPRASAPPAIAGSERFASLCPGSARHLVTSIGAKSTGAKTIRSP